MKEPEVILCVPGPWKDRAELVSRISGESAGYSLAGGKLVHTETKAAFELQVEGPDPRLVKAFRAVGGDWVKAEDLAQISAHTFVLYLIAPGGSPPRAEAAMAAAGGLLRAGGLAVKVESSGLAHSRETWFEFIEQRHLFSAYKAFVVCVTGDQVYSCGMHNLGYRDAIVDTKAAEDPVGLLRAFTFYEFAEKPRIEPGQTFAVAPNATAYRLLEEPCTLYGPDDPFTNPYGMWRLVPRIRR